MKSKTKTVNYKSPCCRIKMSQISDCIHFHYFCPKCGLEYGLDGKTEWETRKVKNGK